MFYRSPLREGKPLHGPEGAGFQTGVAAVEFINQFFDLLPLGVPIGGTGIVDHRQLQAFHCMADQLGSAARRGRE